MSGRAGIAGPLVIAAAAAALALVPTFSPRPSILTYGFLMLLYVALAQSWNLLSGFGGQVSLGHAAFFGLGALVTRFLWLRGLPLPLALAAGIGVSAAAGLIVGAPSLRLHGPYFAIGTFVAGLFLGLVESMSGFLLGNAYREVVGLAMFLLVLSLRPQGLFARS